MPDQALRKHRSNRVFKSLHKPLTCLGVERTLFYFACVAAVGSFNLFNSLLAGIAVFIGGFAFGHWVTNSDPAFLRIPQSSFRFGVVDQTLLSSSRTTTAPVWQPSIRSRSMA
jgi:type IV secretory pathway TrbD component